MLEMQKRALGQARAAEIKAKEAEAIAIRNMKLKEEAAKAKSLFLANVSTSGLTNISLSKLDTGQSRVTNAIKRGDWHE